MLRLTQHTIKIEMETTQSKISKESIIAVIDEMVNSFLAETSGITYKTNDVQQLYIMCLYGRIFDLGNSALNLMKINDHAGVPIILRSQLEAFVDYMNLLKDKDFIKIIAATFVEQKKRLYKNLNSCLDLSEVPPFKNDGTEKIANGCKPQKIWEKFKNINFQSTYITGYFFLCGHGHNDLVMLENRHLEKIGKNHKVVFFKEESLLNFLRFACTLGVILVDTHMNLLAFFNKQGEKKSQIIRDKFLKLNEDAKDLFKHEE